MFLAKRSRRGDGSRDFGKGEGKGPEVEEEVPANAKPVPNEDDPNVELKSERRRSKRRQSSPKIPTDKPRARKKMKMTKKPYDTIDLSDDEPQEAKREEETILAEVTSHVPKADVIEKFRMSMVYGEQVVIPIL
ncbi:hypothetical protein R1flu_025938 [Riccia fluitans]|uniref:Uncharacterized protein n=1 Tax=Riccia fluitans TaxID=41844 RepID=A0ABD1Y2B4_9MARC